MQKISFLATLLASYAIYSSQEVHSPSSPTRVSFKNKVLVTHYLITHPSDPHNQGIVLEKDLQENTEQQDTTDHKKRATALGIEQLNWHLQANDECLIAQPDSNSTDNFTHHIDDWICIDELGNDVYQPHSWYDEWSCIDKFGNDETPPLLKVQSKKHIAIQKKKQYLHAHKTKFGCPDILARYEDIAKKTEYRCPALGSQFQQATQYISTQEQQRITLQKLAQKSDQIFDNFVHELEEIYNQHSHQADQMLAQAEEEWKRTHTVADFINQQCYEATLHAAKKEFSQRYWHNPTNYFAFYDAIAQCKYNYRQQRAAQLGNYRNKSF